MSEDRSRARSNANTALLPTLRLLRAAELGHIADAARERATLRPPAPTVVVLGEPGQGISSVVRLLAPHDMTDPPAGAAYADVLRRLVPPTEAEPGCTWLVASNQHRPEAEPITLGVELAWASCPLGPQVTVVDTPCAGGLASAQAELARSLVANATVAVFVTDAGSPLSGPELDYLEALVLPMSCLVVLVTKCDLYPASWREVVRTNTDLLTARMLHHGAVRVMGFSSVLAAQAMQESDPTRAARLAQVSGWEELLDTLRVELAGVDVAPLSGALLSARIGLLEHRQALQRRHDLLGSDGAEIEQVISGSDAAVADLRERRSTWQLYLDRDLAELRTATSQEATERLEEWREAWRERLLAVRNLRREPTAQSVTADMFAELMTIRADVLRTAGDGLQRIIAELFEGAELPATVEQALGQDHRPLVPRQLSSPTPPRTELLQTMFGFNMGHSMTGGLVGLVSAGTSLATLLSALPVAAGLGMVALTRSSRADGAARQHYVGELSRLVSMEHREILQTFDVHVTRLRPDLIVAFRQHLDHRLRAAQDWHADALRRRATTRDQATELTREIDAEVEVVDHHLSSLETALTELRRS